MHVYKQQQMDSLLKNVLILAPKLGIYKQRLCMAKEHKIASMEIIQKLWLLLPQCPFTSTLQSHEMFACTLHVHSHPPTGSTLVSQLL